MTFLEKYPTTIAIIDANILGSLISTKVPLSLKKIPAIKPGSRFIK